MSNKDWTDKLPGLLEGYTEAAPEGLWDAVQAGVAPKKHRIAAAWWYAGGGILAAAAVIALFVLLRPVTPVPAITVVPGDALAVANEPVEAAVIPDPVSPVIPSSISPVISSDISPVIPGDISPVIPGSDRESPIPEETVYEEPSVDEQIVETEPVTETEQIKEVIPAKEEMADQVGHDEVIVRKPRPINVQISLSTTGYMGQLAQNSTTGVGLPTTPGMRPNAVPLTKSTIGTGDGSAIPMMLGRNKTSTTDATHRQSARFALGIRIGLYGRWGVESGIVSSTLTSEFVSKAGNNSDYTTREIRYRGIPLYVSYNLFQTSRIGIMVNAGPMYEFSKKTSTITETYLGGNRMGQTTDYTLYDDTKWSMNVGASLHLRTGKHGALYVQPGFSYHFQDNSALETFYTAHPAAFSITFGYNFLF